MNYGNHVTVFSLSKAIFLGCVGLRKSIFNAMSFTIVEKGMIDIFGTIVALEKFDERI